MAPIRRPKKITKSKLPKILKAIFIAFVVLTIIMLWQERFSENKSAASKCAWNNNIAVISLQGDILTFDDGYNSNGTTVTSEKVVKDINEANANWRIKAIIITIDSLGGSPVAGKEIADALKNSKKPTIAVVRGTGDSAAYLAATGAQKIYADEFSEVGNIGITMSYLDYSAKNTSEGITYQQISSGEFKDIANPNKVLTKEEKEQLTNYVNELQRVFVDIVSQNRNMERNKVVEIADGSIFTATEAKTRGLIDEIGGLDDAQNYLKQELKIEPSLCYIE